MTSEVYDIAVVGAGLVGASLACAIARSEGCEDLRIALVEPGSPPVPFHGDHFDPRVVALTRQSQSFLDTLGAWPLIQAGRLCPYTRMFVWDGNGTGSIAFDGRDFGEANLGHIVENSLALKAILKRLEHLPNVHLLRGRKVQQVLETAGEESPAAHSLLLEDGNLLRASLVLAADGGNSRMRELLAMETREWDYGQDAIVTTVRSEKSHDFTAWQIFLASGPLAFLPLCQAGEAEQGEAHFSSIVWSAERKRAEELMAMDDPAFARALESAFEHKLGKIESVAPRFSFPLRQRHAVDYVRPGFALVGDAAHTIHPLAGQGVNLGLLDARALAGEIQRAVQRRVPLSDYSILRRYQRHRKGENLAMMALMEGFKRLFGSENPGLHLLRNMGMRQVDNVPQLKNLLARHAMGIDSEAGPQSGLEA